MSRRGVLLGLLLVSAPYLAAEEREKTRWGRGVSVEVYGGWGSMSPGDLDLQGKSEEQWHDINRLRRWDYTRSLDSRFSWSAAGQRDLSFPSLEDPINAGFRLRHDLRAGFGLSIGLGYLVRDQLTDIDQSYQISDHRPDRTFYPSPYTVQVRYPGYLVSVRAWTPQLGLHAGLPLGRVATLSFAVAGGPLLVRSRLVSESYLRTTYATGYWSETQSLVEMKGNGSGWALDLGGELRLVLWGPVALTLEGGYAVRRAGRIEGPRRWDRRSVDSNAAADLQSSSGSGVWQVGATRYSFPWGQYALESVSVRGDTPEPGSRDFVLDLSGIKVQAGVSVSFARQSRPPRR